jgi:hypothetical protein
MSFQCGAGWERVLNQYFDEVAHALPAGTQLRLHEVFEKYGSLRIDAAAMGDVTPVVLHALNKAEVLAESRSYRCCETCGALGSLRDQGRLYVACETHARGAAALPPDESGVSLDGIAYEYDEGIDDLIVVEREREATE